jgi:hypothetical protein
MFGKWTDYQIYFEISAVGETKPRTGRDSIYRRLMGLEHVTKPTVLQTV